MRDLEHKVAVVTGGTGELGKAVTRTFLDAGAQVVVIYRTEARLAPLLNHVGGEQERLMLLPADVMQESQLRSSLQHIADRFGRIDTLIHLVGGYIGDIPVDRMEELTWDHMMNLNLKTAFLCCKEALGHMLDQKSGKIIMIGSRSAIRFTPGSVAYAVAKAGVHTLTQALAREVGGKNININAVLPGVIDTPANRRAMPQADSSKWVKPRDLAEVILFLASDAANALQGALIPVYGKG